MMSVTSPVVAFHFLVTYFANEFENIKKTETAPEYINNGANDVRLFDSLLVLGLVLMVKSKADYVLLILLAWNF